LQVIAISAVLVLYGNVAAYVLGATAVTRGWLGTALGVALTIAFLAWARRSGLSLAELGLRRHGALSSAVLGAAVAAIGGICALVFLRFPPLVGGPISYLPLRDLTDADLYLRILVLMPLDTVMPEEVAFRGVLLALLRRRFALYRAVALSAVPFVLWHAVMVRTTVAQTNLAAEPPLFLLAVIGAVLALSAGGIAFAYLRALTGHLAAPIAAHWTFNSALLVGLRSLEAAT
jgi:membrane protease YdiL (CAAX protease family)